MKHVPVLLVAIGATACVTPGDGLEPCDAGGIRTEFLSQVLTPSGNLVVTTDLCVEQTWSTKSCGAAGPEHCDYFFAPNTPAKTPVEYVFGDFVWWKAVGHIDSWTPEEIAGTNNLKVGLDTLMESRLDEGYRTSPVQISTFVDGYPAYLLTVACDHPDIDLVCPFTWDYFLIDLGDIEPGLFMDLTAWYADFVEAGNFGAERPTAYDDYWSMIQTVNISVE